MFANLKKLLSKIHRTEPETIVPPQAPLNGEPGVPLAKLSEHPLPAASPTVAWPGAVAVPLESVIVGLPANLRPKPGRSLVAGVSILVPIQKITDQLPRGSVKISFRELKQAAPAGMFREHSAEDATLVELPIKEILSRLNPAYLKRRLGQKPVEVPPESPAVFGPNGTTFFSHRHQDPEKNRLGVPSPVPPPALTPQRSNPPLAMLREDEEKGTGRRSSSPTNGSTTSDLIKGPLPCEGPKVTHPSEAREGEHAKDWTLSVTIQAISGKWPSVILQEIAENNLFPFKVELPSVEIEQALGCGRIVFTWGRFRSWIKKTPPVGGSPHDDIHLELPLPSIVTLFLAQRKEVNPKKALPIAQNFPDVFRSATALARLVTSANAKPSLSSQSIPSPISDSSRRLDSSTEPAAPDLARIFGQPDKRTWTPVEIVQKTSTLSGVAGAVIALQDGLLVAAELPPGYSAEAFAAFLPQMFEKMNQYAQAMKLGSPGQLNLLVENLSLQIYKTSRVYFAVVSQRDRPLPMAELSSIASELERSSK
jgi:predicted regulator of Ras-like GTPase activity (Roadblock/LC7/MglB family)